MSVEVWCCDRRVGSLNAHSNDVSRGIEFAILEDIPPRPSTADLACTPKIRTLRLEVGRRSLAIARDHYESIQHYSKPGKSMSFRGEPIPEYASCHFNIESQEMIYTWPVLKVRPDDWRISSTLTSSSPSDLDRFGTIM